VDELCILEHEPDARVQLVCAEIADVAPTDADRTLPDIVEPSEQGRER